MSLPEARIVRLAVLESYGVRWSLETFARDLLQNFFDAAPDFRDVVLEVDRPSGVVSIRGPSVFDLDLLAYIGATTKRDGRTAGGFGEGFKVCALVGVRDFKLAMTAGSGDLALEVFFDPVPLGRELCYRVTPMATPFSGSWVRLEGCNAEVCAMFERSRQFFRHPDNPNLRHPVVEDFANGVALFRGHQRDRGEIYYRRQLRGIVTYWGQHGEAPLTLVHDGPIDALEGDRDRRDLPARPIARAIGLKLEPDALYRAYLHLKPYWERGSETLQGLIEAGVERKLTYTWPSRWLARTHKNDGGLTVLAERLGIQIAVYGLSLLGMPTPLDHFKGTLETRPPTDLERARFSVVAGLYADLNGKPATVTALEVFEPTDRAAIRGQHLGTKIITDAGLLAEGFDAVVATGLHELAHETGGDTDAAFHGQLKHLMNRALHQPERVTQARERYGTVTAEEGRVLLGSVEDRWPLFRAEDKPDPVLYDYQRGVPCLIVTLPCFPPVRTLLVRLARIAKAMGTTLQVSIAEVTGPIAPVNWLAPGVLTLRIGVHDVAMDEVPDEAIGYRVRSYGGALLPDDALIERAIRRAIDAKHTGERGFDAYFDAFEHGIRMWRPLVGIPPDGLPPKSTDPLMDGLEGALDRYTRHFGWRDPERIAIETAGTLLIDRMLSSQLDQATAWKRIHQTLEAGRAFGRRLKEADQIFDDASKLEREMIAYVEMAVLMVFVQEDEAERETRATAAWERMRALCEHLLDLELSQELKPSILEKAFEQMGISVTDQTCERLDIDQLEQRIHAITEVARALDLEKGENSYLSRHDLGMQLNQAKTQAQNARNLEERIRASKLATALVNAFEETLAATGDELEAAARCLELAAQLKPEEAKP